MNTTEFKFSKFSQKKSLISQVESHGNNIQQGRIFYPSQIACKHPVIKILWI